MARDSGSGVRVGESAVRREEGRMDNRNPVKPRRDDVESRRNPRDKGDSSGQGYTAKKAEPLADHVMARRNGWTMLLREEQVEKGFGDTALALHLFAPIWRATGMAATAPLTFQLPGPSDGYCTSMWRARPLGLDPSVQTCHASNTVRSSIMRIRRFS